MSKMSEHVNLKKIIKFLEERGHSLKYDDFRKVFEEKIDMESYFVTILETAKGLSNREVLNYQKDLLVDYSKAK